MTIFDLPAGTRCALCDAVLAGRIACDPHGRYFCERHTANGRSCRFCDRFFISAGKADACPVCSDLRIDTLQAALAERNGAAAWYAHHGLPLPRPLPPVELRGSLGASPLLSGVGMFGYVARRATFAGTDPNARIVIERGLPAAVLSLVMVHELGHLALAQSGLELPTWLEEGSCDWLAHRYLATLTSPEALIQQRRLEQRNDKLYGAGFQWVFQRLGHGDPRALIPLLRTQCSRPTGSRPFRFGA